MPAKAHATELCYELHTLGWKAFQNLCITIIGEVFGQTAQSFFDSHDGGRDGAFHGMWTPTSGEAFTGTYTAQCKFSVTKPFSTAELVARLAVIQRRHHTAESPEIHAGPLTLRLDQHEAFLSGEALKTTPTEFAFLRALARHAGKIVTQRQLLREVWGPQGEGQTHYLRVYANHLRKKLGDRMIIRNEPGIGYRLIEPS